MTLHRSLFAAAALGFGLLQAGCLAESEVNPIDDLGLETLEGGDHGTNGMGPDDFHGHEATLWSAMDQGINAATNTHVAQLLADANSSTLEYAVHSALAEGAAGPGTHTGWGHLSTTTSWSTAALPTSAKLDVLTIMIAQVNPFLAEVPIRFTGQSVTPNGMTLLQAAQYNVEEALWVARQTPTGIEYIVWPLEVVKLNCLSSESAVLTRVCTSREAPGGMVPDCGVQVRPRLYPDCTQDPATKNWTCLGRPAIKTWLSTLGYLTLYPGCDPLPQ